MPLLPRCSRRWASSAPTWSACKLIGIDAGAFWGNMQAAVDFRHDIVNGIIKSVVFGIAVSLIAVFEGYNARPTAEGVSTRDDAHRRRELAVDPRARLRPHRLHVSRGIGGLMNRSAIDLWVGIFVVIGIGAIAFLSLKVGNLHVGQQRAGLSPRRRVRQHRRPEAARAGQGGGRRRRARRANQARSADVPGRRVDAASTRATSSRRTRSRRSSPRACSARCTSASIPAATRRCSRTAHASRKTQSAMVLEKLIGQFLFDKAASGRTAPGASDAPPAGAPKAAGATGAAIAGGTK